MAQNPDDRGGDRGDRDRYGRRGGGYDAPPKKGANPILLLIVAVIVSVVGSLYLVNSSIVPGLMTKGDFDEKIKGIASQVSQMQSSVASSTSAISAIPNTVTAQVNSALANVSSQVNNMINVVNDLKSQVQGYSGKIDSANSAVSSMNAKVDALTKSDTDQKAINDDLIARVKKLETTPVTPTPTTTPTITPSVVTASIKSMSNVLSLDTTQTDNRTLLGSMRVLLTNTSANEQDDIVIDLSLDFSGVIHHPSVQVLGGTTWRSVDYEYSGDYLYSAEFVSSEWGVNIAGSSTKTLYITIKLVGNSAYNVNDYYDFNAKVTVE